jgi:hypothetical protein
MNKEIILNFHNKDLGELFLLPFFRSRWDYEDVERVSENEIGRIVLQDSNLNEVIFRFQTSDNSYQPERLNEKTSDKDEAIV